MLTKNDFKQIRSIVNESGEDVKSETRKEIRKVHKKLDHMDKFLDKELMADRRRIVRIEEHLGFPQT